MWLRTCDEGILSPSQGPPKIRYPHHIASLGLESHFAVSYSSRVANQATNRVRSTRHCCGTYDADHMTGSHQVPVIQRIDRDSLTQRT